MQRARPVRYGTHLLACEMPRARRRAIDDTSILLLYLTGGL